MHEKKEVTLSDFADKLMEEDKKELFLIKRYTDEQIYTEIIKNQSKPYDPKIKYYHKHHNQKPS